MKKNEQNLFIYIFSDIIRKRNSLHRIILIIMWLLIKIEI